jgi:hypothetical protein
MTHVREGFSNSEAHVSSEYKSNSYLTLLEGKKVQRSQLGTSI